MVPKELLAARASASNREPRVGKSEAGGPALRVDALDRDDAGLPVDVAPLELVAFVSSVTCGEA